MSAVVLDFVWLAVGLLVLYLGAESFLRGAMALSQRLGVSPLVIGMTVVGMGTSMPELIVNLSAIGHDAAPLALGNIVGSNIANLGLILGCAALIAPLQTSLRLLRWEAPMMALAAFLVFWLARDGELSRWDGALLLLGLLPLTLQMLAYRTTPDAELDNQAEASSLDAPFWPLWKALVWTGGGLGALLLGANWMVAAAIDLARLLGWSEQLIGLTIMAIGTSLPELAASVIAVRHGQTDLAVGNVVGSNLFNCLLVLGTTASLQAMPVDQAFAAFEIPYMVGLSLLLLPMLGRSLVLGRKEASVLLLAYGVALAKPLLSG